VLLLCNTTGRLIARRFPRATVVSLDHRPRNMESAPPPRVVADALRLPFAEGSFDIVLCSSILHHFPDPEVIRLIASLRQVARRFLVLLDIERNALAYRFLPWTRWILRWSRLTVHDGAVSVAASFCLEELVALAQAAGADVVAERKHRPWFRVSVIADSVPRNGGAAARRRIRRENGKIPDSIDGYRVDGCGSPHLTGTGPRQARRI
jgi:SAM-dependent methyltransferase